MQHLNRLRKELIAEGHLVPPLPCRPGMGETSDPEIRGYVRKDEEGEDKETTRPVRFDEPMDDRKFSIPSVFNLEDAENQGADLFTPERSFAEDVFSPHSPTPGPRAYRPMSATRRGYQLPPRPAPMELLENEDFRHAPLDADHLENGGNPVEEVSEHNICKTAVLTKFRMPNMTLTWPALKLGVLTIVTETICRVLVPLLHMVCIRVWETFATQWITMDLAMAIISTVAWHTHTHTMRMDNLSQRVRMSNTRITMRPVMAPGDTICPILALDPLDTQCSDLTTEVRLHLPATQPLNLLIAPPTSRWNFPVLRL